jgi:hypothetical protein
MTSTNTPAANVIVCAPRLMVDGSDKLSPRGRQERRVVWALFLHLASNGWKPVDVEDGYDEATKVASALDAMEVIFNLDDAHVTFTNDAGASHVVYLVRGNSPEEVVSDYSFSAKGADNFDEVMASFDAEAVL